MGETRARQAEQAVFEQQQWIADLQSGMYVNCVYCGHRYGPADTTPVAMAEILREHIEQCPEHPMSKLKAKYRVVCDDMAELHRVVRENRICFGCAHAAAIAPFPGRPSGERPCHFCKRNPDWSNCRLRTWYDGSEPVSIPMDCYTSLDMHNQVSLWTEPPRKLEGVTVPNQPGEALKWFRLNVLKMGLRRFAEWLGVKPSQLHNVEQGRPYHQSPSLPFSTRGEIDLEAPVCIFPFKGPDCGYAGSDTTCAKSIRACLEKHNLARWPIPPEQMPRKSTVDTGVPRQ